jgi:hypothetical protein
VSHSRARGLQVKLAIAAVVSVGVAGMLALMTVAALAGLSTTPATGSPGGYGASVRALSGIPPHYLGLYRQAAARYALDWAILAGIGKVECDHGRDSDPSCTREGAVNSAGAGGPAQFLASTWSAYGVDGDGDGWADRWDPADAIFAMANYLHASGAPGDYRKAIFAYNHAGWYVTRVERWASLYRGAPEAGTESVSGEDSTVAGPGAGPVRLMSGSRASLLPSDGHVALVPTQAPPVAQAMVIAGNELQDLPYGPTGHPDPRGAYSEDCSSMLNYVLYRSGVRPIAEIVRQNPLAQDYVHWGDPGPGRWMTIYAATIPTNHVFVVIAGLRLDTSHHGTDVGPNRGEDGPRWRVLDHIPTWAHWTVRHPPGL